MYHALLVPHLCSTSYEVCLVLYFWPQPVDGALPHILLRPQFPWSQIQLVLLLHTSAGPCHELQAAQNCPLLCAPQWETGEELVVADPSARVSFVAHIGLGCRLWTHGFLEVQKTRLSMFTASECGLNFVSTLCFQHYIQSSLHPDRSQTLF